MKEQHKEQLLDIASGLMQIALLTEQEFNTKHKMTKDRAIMDAVKLIKLFVDSK